MKRRLFQALVSSVLWLSLLGGFAHAQLLTTDVLPEKACGGFFGSFPNVSNNAVNVPGQFCTVPDTIATIFNLVIVISAAIFVILLLVGGIQYLTGAGNEETTAKARRLMVDAIVGLIIVLAAFAIGRFILGRFGFVGRGSGSLI